MELLIRTYRKANLLSLDVVLGSMSSALFLSRSMDHQVKPLLLVLLGMVVWVIYTVDHLVDASRNSAPTSERHRFHRTWHGVLKAIVAIVILASALLLCYVPSQVMTQGAIVGIAICFYLLLQNRLYIFKEFCVAILYVAGLLVAAGELLNVGSHSILVLSFTLTAFANLLLFSWFDYEVDVKDSQASIVTIVGKENAGKIFMASFVAVSIMLLISVTRDLLIVWIVCCGHVAIFLFSAYFRQHDRYRLAGEALFFLPAILTFLT